MPLIKLTPPAMLFVPDKACVPLPIFVRMPVVPRIFPLKALGLVLSAPRVRVWPPTMPTWPPVVPPPLKEPMMLLWLFRSRNAPAVLASETGENGLKALAAPAWMAPALIVVAPV